MSGESDSRSFEPPHRVKPLRWWNTLAFRLGAVVNITVIGILALSAWVDYRRDAEMQLQHSLSRLQEEARVLGAAWSEFQDTEDFQRFVDGFCHQMTASVSPGHHIALFDANGEVLVRAHERAGPELEHSMQASAANSVRTFDLGDEQFAAYALNIDQGVSLVVAVSLQPVKENLRIQGISRATATGVLVIVLFGVTTVCLLAWVRNPLRGLVRAVSAVSERRFDQRVQPRGAAELRYLANGMNAMVQTLGQTEHRRAAEMQRAREIQRALVGDRSLRVNGWGIQAVFLPAESIGGDFFEMLPLRDGSTLVAVIDVTGHGVPGALCTALLRSSLRHLIDATSDVGEIACGLNRDLCDIAAAGVFATAVLVRLAANGGGIEYANAGHDRPLLTTPDGGVTSLNHANLLLGVEAEAEYEVARGEIPPGSRLFVFTDGLHEAMSPQGEQFGRKRVTAMFAESHHMPLDEQLAAALKGVRAFCGREDFEDDVTVLGISSPDSGERDGASVPSIAL